MIQDRLAAIITGINGAGKGSGITNARLVHFERINTGDYFRIVNSEVTDTGKMCSSNDANIYVAGRIRQGGKRFIIDGYPRGADQAEVCFNFLTAMGYRVVVLSLKADIKVCVERCLARALKYEKEGKKVRPEDKDPEKVLERTELHKTLVSGALQLFGSKRVPIFNIDANLLSESVVGERIRKLLLLQENNLAIEIEREKRFSQRTSRALPPNWDQAYTIVTE